MTQAAHDSLAPSGDDGHQALRRLSAHRRLFLTSLIVLIGLVGLSSFGYDPLATGDASSSTATENGPANLVAAIGSDGDVERTAAKPVPAEIQQLLTRLESADEFLRGTKYYSANFTQQVFKEGRQFDPERMQLKVQHEPFAVFMQWERDGQQALYVEGQHDNKMLVHPTRGIGALRKVWILEPDHKLAMRSARRPVTEIGMLNMVNLLLGFHHEHILQSHLVSEPVQQGDASRTRFVLTFDTPQQNPYFAKTVLELCDERHFPLRIENYGWTEDNHVGPLLESYDYADVCLEGCVTEADFDRNNAAYSF